MFYYTSYTCNIAYTTLLFFSEWKSNLFKNLSQCTDVIHQEEHFSAALKEAGFASPETPFLLQLEKSLLDIALPALSDGTFYCSLFKIENNCYCRFFESGVLEGYFLAEGNFPVTNQ